MPIQPFDSEINLGGFSTVAGVATLNGSITGFKVEEYDGTKYVDTNNIFRTDRDWKMTLNWRLFGTLLDLTPPAVGMVTAELHGKFVVWAYFEGIGSTADEKDLRGDTTQLGGIDLMAGRKGDPVAKGSRSPATPTAKADPEETEWQYEETFTILGENPNAKPAAIQRYLKPGAYRVSVNLTFQQPDIDQATGLQKRDSATGELLFRPGPMAGFMELPGMIQVYDPGTY
jgi:hypothetical protein